MSLITKDHLSLTLQTIKNLLSRKADKSEVELKADKTDLETKIDRSEIPDAVELATEMGLVSPVAAEDGAIYTDENGAMYSL